MAWKQIQHSFSVSLVSDWLMLVEVGLRVTDDVDMPVISCTGVSCTDDTDGSNDTDDTDDTDCARSL